MLGWIYCYASPKEVDNVKPGGNNTDSFRQVYLTKYRIKLEVKPF